MICPKSDSESEFHVMEQSHAMDIEEESRSAIVKNLNSSRVDDLKRQIEEMKKLLEEKEMEK